MSVLNSNDVELFFQQTTTGTAHEKKFIDLSFNTSQNEFDYVSLHSDTSVSTRVLGIDTYSISLTCFSTSSTGADPFLIEAMRESLMSENRPNLYILIRESGSTTFNRVRVYIQSYNLTLNPLSEDVETYSFAVTSEVETLTTALTFTTVNETITKHGSTAYIERISESSPSATARTVDVNTARTICRLPTYDIANTLPLPTLSSGGSTIAATNYTYHRLSGTFYRTGVYTFPTGVVTAQYTEATYTNIAETKDLNLSIHFNIRPYNSFRTTSSSTGNRSYQELRSGSIDVNVEYNTYTTSFNINNPTGLSGLSVGDEILISIGLDRIRITSLGSLLNTKVFTISMIYTGVGTKYSKGNLQLASNMLKFNGRTNAYHSLAVFNPAELY